MALKSFFYVGDNVLLAEDRLRAKLTDFGSAESRQVSYTKIFPSSLVPVSKLSYENEFDLHENEPVGEIFLCMVLH